MKLGLTLPLGEMSFDATVRDQPHDSHPGEQRYGSPAVPPGQGRADDVDEYRHGSLSVVAHGNREGRVGTVCGNESVDQNQECDGRHEQPEAIKSNGGGIEMVFSHPSGRKWQ